MPLQQWQEMHADSAPLADTCAKVLRMNAEEECQLYSYSQSMWKKAHQTVECYAVMYASKCKKQSGTDPLNATPYAEYITGKIAFPSALKLTVLAAG